MMQRLFSLALVAILPSVAAATTSIRRLEDGGAYGELNGYFKFSRCLRVKIVEDNDDDGNAYFYNGAYRSQSIAYASFLQCDQGCGSCDASTAYVAELEGVLERGVEYSDGYCQACANRCRRRLEDAEQEGEAEAEAEEERYYSVDCNTCKAQCPYLNGEYSKNGEDESNYLDCQYQYTGDDGLDYYSAPTCASDGSLVMGIFYDGTL